jgi:hypothetical protein
MSQGFRSLSRLRERAGVRVFPDPWAEHRWAESATPDNLGRGKDVTR